VSDDLEKEWRERLVKSNLDLIVLRLLKEKQRWGYEISVEIRDRLNVYLSAGTLYPLLHSLEDVGLIEAIWESETRRGRRIYRITRRGARFLSAGEKASEIFRRMRAE